MAFSVSKSRPFRSLGLYKSNGKHAAPKGWVPEPRPAADDQVRRHRPAHAAAMPRLTGPHADGETTADSATADSGTAMPSGDSGSSASSTDA